MITLKESVLANIEDTLTAGDNTINDIEIEQKLKSFNVRKNNKVDGRDMFRKPLAPGDFVLTPYKRTTYDPPKIVLDIVDKIVYNGECRLRIHGYVNSNMLIKVDDNILKLLGVKI